MVGKIGSFLGERGVNIATMSLARDAAGGMALMVLNLDSVPDESVVSSIRSQWDIGYIRLVSL